MALTNCSPIGDTVVQATVIPDATQQETSLPTLVIPTPTQFATPVPPAIINQLPRGASDSYIKDFLSPDEKWFILPIDNMDLLFTSYIAIESAEESLVLQNTPDEEMGKGYNEYIWSPDSTAIAASGPGGETRDYNQLTIFTIEGDQINQSMIEIEMKGSYIWSPDGQKIAVFDDSGRLNILNRNAEIIKSIDIPGIEEKMVSVMLWAGDNIFFIVRKKNVDDDQNLRTKLYKIDADLEQDTQAVFIAEENYINLDIMGWNEEKQSLLIETSKLQNHGQDEDCIFYILNWDNSASRNVLEAKCYVFMEAYSDPEHRYSAIDGMRMDDQQWIFDWATEQFHPYGDIYILRWLISEEGFLYSKYFDSDNESMGRYYDIVQP